MNSKENCSRPGCGKLVDDVYRYEDGDGGWICEECIDKELGTTRNGK